MNHAHVVVEKNIKNVVEDKSRLQVITNIFSISDSNNNIEYWVLIIGNLLILAQLKLKSHNKSLQWKFCRVPFLVDRNRQQAKFH